MFSTPLAASTLMQKPGCSTVSEAQPVQESPATRSARKRLHTRCQAALPVSSGQEVLCRTHQGSPAQSSAQTPPPHHSAAHTKSNLLLPTLPWRDCTLWKPMSISLEQRERLQVIKRDCLTHFSCKVEPTRKCTRSELPLKKYILQNNFTLDAWPKDA